MKNYSNRVILSFCSVNASYSISIKGSFRVCSIQEGLLTENGTWKGRTRRTGNKKPTSPLTVCFSYKRLFSKFFFFFFKVIKDMEAYLDTMSPVIDVMSQLYKEKGLDTDEKV